MLVGSALLAGLGQGILLVVAGLILFETKIYAEERLLLTVFPDALPQPLTSSLDFVGGEPGVPNLVMSKLGGAGSIGIFNFSPGGTTDAVVDVVGWYAKT